MEVTITKQESRTFVKLSGRIDTTNAAKFQEDIKTLLDGDCPDIEIDCSELTYTSSQGLRVFLMLQKGVSAKGGSMVLKNMVPNVKEVFDITGFSNIIKIC